MYEVGEHKYNHWFDGLSMVSRFHMCKYVIVVFTAYNQLLDRLPIDTVATKYLRIVYHFFSVRLLSVLRDHSFFHPRHNGQWPPTSKDFYTRSYPLYYFLIFILEKEPVFPFSMLSAKQGNYCYHFYNVFGMTRSLTGF